MSETKKPKKLPVKAETTNEVMALLEQAVTQKVPVETLERLFALRKEVKAEQAKEAFTHALTKFQKECPVIEKKKPVLNKDGTTVRYKYAPIDSVVEQIKNPLSNNELSYTWDVEKKEEHMAVTCKLTHVLGHSETSTFEIPIVESQFMSSPQSYATAQSYAKRYTLLNSLGIATAEEDTDATDTGKDADAKNVKSQIQFRLRTLGEKANTKEEITKAVKKLAQLELVEKNYPEIANRLSIKIDEQNQA